MTVFYSDSGVSMSSQQQRLTHNSSSPVAAAYMSDENQRLLYAALVREVHKQTNGNVTMGPMPLADMQAIMLQAMDDRLSLKELNERAFNYALRLSMNNIASYLGYLRHISDTNGHRQNDVSSILRPANTREFKETPGREML